MEDSDVKERIDNRNERGNDNDCDNDGDYEDIQGLTTTRRRMCCGWR